MAQRLAVGRGRVGGRADIPLLPSWVVNQLNPPDLFFDWKNNRAFLKASRQVVAAKSLVTVSRASVGYVNDNAGNWTSVAANQPRVSDLGLLIEEARTNSIRNSSCAGAVVMADGVELLTNGNFASGGAGWTSQAIGGSVVFAAGSVTMGGDGANSDNNAITQQITGLVVGRSYVISIAGSTGGAIFLASVGTAAFNAATLAKVALASNANNSTFPDRVAFTATATSHWITLGRQNAFATAVTSISVKDGERVQNGGFTANPINASQSTVQNGWQWTLNAGTGTVTWNGSNSVTLAGDNTHSAAIGAPISVVSGFTYTISIDLAGAGSGTVLVGPGFQSGTYLGSTLFGAGTGKKFQFTATATGTVFVTVAINGATSFTISNVSIQSAGAIPTNAFLTMTATSGLLAQVVSVGIESGINYYDVRWFGTLTALINGTPLISTEGGLQIAAAVGQTWSQSAFSYVSAGSLANITSLATLIVENNSSGTSLSAGGAVSITTPSGALGLNRRSSSYTLTNSASAFVNQRLVQMTASSGAVIDVTVRLGWPQLENNGINSSIASATIAAGGSGGVTGTAVYSVGGGTGTAATLNVTVSGGAITAINSVANAGSYSAFPTQPATLTYVSGTASGVTGATVNLTPTNNAAAGLATSPIVTSSGAVTRAQDVITMSASALGSAFTAFVQAVSFPPTFTGPALGNSYALDISDGSISNRAVMFRSQNGGNVAGFRYGVGGSNVFGPASVSLWAQNAVGKAAIAVQSGAQGAAFNGTALTPGTGVGTITPTEIAFGVSSAGEARNATLNGFLQQVGLWYSQKVPDAQLASMTT